MKSLKKLTDPLWQVRRLGGGWYLIHKIVMYWSQGLYRTREDARQARRIEILKDRLGLCVLEQEALRQELAMIGGDK